MSLALIGRAPLSLAAELTPTEQRWLTAIQPVLQSAREERLPLDIVVQPQPTPGLPPLAMAHLGGRCKLVFSMRGNTEAEDALRSVPPALGDIALELMAAHELAHCRRHVAGTWHREPEGRPHSPDGAPAADRAQQREEALADLAGLAWVASRHPAHYAAAQDWLWAMRSERRVPGQAHDTVPWLRLALDRPPPRPAPDEPSDRRDAALQHWVAGLWVDGEAAAD